MSRRRYIAFQPIIVVKVYDNLLITSRLGMKKALFAA